MWKFTLKKERERREKKQNMKQRKEESRGNERRRRELINMNEKKMRSGRQLTNTRTNKPVVWKCTQGNGRERTGERNKGSETERRRNRTIGRREGLTEH